jgi:hypothetical protein
VTHGTRSGYNNGCRCRQCTTANSAASRARRERIANRSTTIATTAPRPYKAISEVHHSGVKLPENRAHHAVSLAEPVTSMSQSPVREHSNPGQFGPGLLMTRRFSATAALARPPVKPHASKEAAIAAWDDYARRLSFYLAGRGENPDFQDARRLCGQR